MSARITFFCSVCSTDFVDSLEDRHHHLFVELWTLSEIYFAIEILDFKNFCSTFGRKSDKFW